MEGEGGRWRGWQRLRRKGNITKKHDGEEKEVEETMNVTSEVEETRERT